MSSGPWTPGQSGMPPSRAGSPRPRYTPAASTPSQPLAGGATDPEAAGAAPGWAQQAASLLGLSTEQLSQQGGWGQTWSQAPGPQAQTARAQQTTPMRPAQPGPAPGPAQPGPAGQPWQYSPPQGSSPAAPTPPAQQVPSGPKGLGFMNFLLFVATIVFAWYVGRTWLVPSLADLVDCANAGVAQCLPEGAEWRWVGAPVAAIIGAWSLMRGAIIEGRQRRGVCWVLNAAGFAVLLVALWWAAQ